MTNDPTIREQTYRYFLQEAPELLQILEQELLSLREDYSINKVNTLMRATHTLKGAAASVGLETIKTVAHSLEDIFKALFNPDLSIDAEIEALIFEGYECLRVPLTAELTGGQVNDAEILDRTAAIFAQLQEKLGDCFGAEAYIPSSVELGFDVTQSIFEVGVTQRLDELAAAVASADEGALAKRDAVASIATTLQTQAEVFLGLAQSLNLPGFGAIAQATLAALNCHPDRVVTIARVALADFQAGRAAVLEGDRTQGGQPSLALQQLADPTTSAEQGSWGEEEHRSKPTDLSLIKNEFRGLQATDGEASESLPPCSSAEDAPDFDAQESATQPELSCEISATDSELSASELESEESINSLLEIIWGGQATLDSQSSEQGRETLLPDEHGLASRSVVLDGEIESYEERENAELNSAHHPTLRPQEPEARVNIPLSEHLRTNNPPIPQKDQVSASRTVRVNVEHLEQLNYLIEDLLTNQNHQSLQNEQLRAAVRVLLLRIQQHHHRLGELQDWSDRQFNLPEQRQTGKRSQVSKLKVERSNLQPATPLDHFDSLELDRYSEAQLLVQSVLEDAVQLVEATDAIDLFTTQSNQTLEKQRRLLTSSRDALMQARMLPLGELFGRFHRVLQQLEIRHNKRVALEVSGTEVLVDKVVVEKLYDPLLHLVRNAFDHGIEPLAVRQQQGKPSQGRIEICASHRGKYLVIEVRDDGQGLDFEAIRQQAVERQLVDAERANSLNEDQLTDLLFEPGFSTASGVNELSGRGIGLDVVRAHLQALQGSISVYSERYRGTTFILEIPLSLTIAKLLLCQAGDRIYALFADAIEQILIPQGDQIRCWEDGKAIRWGKGDLERLIPVHQLSKVLNYCSRFSEPLGSQPHYAIGSQRQVMPVILIRYQDTLMGLEVDQLIGEQELVIRPLGAMLVPPSYVYGGSILADGRLTLVLNGAALMQYVFDQQSGSSRNSRKDSYPDDTPRYTNALRSLVSSTPSILTSSQEQRLLPARTQAEYNTQVDSDVKIKPRKVVLVVDDSITVRQSLALTLQKAGYQVLQAKDGYEAIDQLRHQTDIQLVLCDIEMPRMNGFEFLKYRQQDSTLINIPVVILTSRSAPKHRLIASELGANSYITKPYLEHKLLATVTDVLEKKILNSVVSVRD